MARCGCGGDCGCSLVSGDGVVVTGSGSTANPWKPNAAIADCADVRACLSANQGAAFDATTGMISVCLSPNAGQAITRDVNGCLYVGAGASTVTAGCGLTGNGAPATPLTADTSAWPYACDIATQGGVVSCDPATGRLWSEPRSHSMMQSVFFDQTYNLPVPATATQSNLIQTVTGSFTNPDPCRTAIVISMQEMEFFLTLPANARAEYGFDADNMVQHTNRGATTETDFHVQVSKVINRGVIAAGATANYSFGAYLGLGTSGATYTQLNGILRILMITQ